MTRLGGRLVFFLRRAKYLLEDVGDATSRLWFATVRAVRRSAGWPDTKTIRAIESRYLREVLPQADLVARPLPELTVILVDEGAPSTRTSPCPAASLEHLPGSAEVILLKVQGTFVPTTESQGIKVIALLTPSVGQALNAAVAAARGKYLAILSHDSRPFPGSLAVAVIALSNHTNIGAIAAQEILPNGSVRCAGRALTNGSSVDLAAGTSAFSPSAMFRRDVAAASGAIVVVARQALAAAGGFTEATSLDRAVFRACLSLRRAGWRVVYEPDVVVLSTGVKERNVHTSVESLDASPPTPAAGDETRLRILIIEDHVPDDTGGSGLPRTKLLLSELVRLGHSVTLFPTADSNRTWRDTYSVVDREMEVILGSGHRGLRRFCQRRCQDFDVVIACRPQNLALLKAVAPAWFTELPRPRIVYDSEALVADRLVQRRRLEGVHLTESRAARMKSAEVEEACACDAVIAVSDGEKRAFSDGGCARTYVLSHAVEPNPTPAPFDKRHGFIFLGSIQFEWLHNTDAMKWFVGEVWPRIHSALAAEIVIVGSRPAYEAHPFARAGVRLAGVVRDLRGAFGGARVSVAPVRAAAGIPLKVITAAAHGVPVVMTSALAEALGWRHEVEALVADDAEAFARECLRLYSDSGLWEGLRERALRRLHRDYTHERFRVSLSELLGDMRSLLAADGRRWSGQVRSSLRFMGTRWP